MSMECTANSPNGMNFFPRWLDVSTSDLQCENTSPYNLSKLFPKNASEKNFIYDIKQKKLEIESVDIVNFIWEKEIIVQRSLSLDRVIYPKKIIFLVFLSVVFSILLIPVFIYFNFWGSYLGKVLSGGGFLLSSYIAISSLDQARLFKEKDTV